MSWVRGTDGRLKWVADVQPSTTPQAPPALPNAPPGTPGPARFDEENQPVRNTVVVDPNTGWSGSLAQGILSALFTPPKTSYVRPGTTIQPGLSQGAQSWLGNTWNPQTTYTRGQAPQAGAQYVGLPFATQNNSVNAATIAGGNALSALTGGRLPPMSQPHQNTYQAPLIQGANYAQSAIGGEWVNGVWVGNTKTVDGTEITGRPQVEGGRGYFIPWTYNGVRGSLDTLTGQFLVNGVVYNPPQGGGGGGGYAGYAWPSYGAARSGGISNGLVNWRIGL